MRSSEWVVCYVWYGMVWFSFFTQASLEFLKPFRPYIIGVGEALVCLFAFDYCFECLFLLYWFLGYV